MSLYPSALGLYVTHTRDRETALHDADQPASLTKRQGAQDAGGDNPHQSTSERDPDAAWTISVDDYFNTLVTRSQPRPWMETGAGIVRVGRAAVETALVTGIGLALAAGALLLR